MNEPRDESTDELLDEPAEPSTGLDALVQALAEGAPIDWQRAEAEAGSQQAREQVRALAAISTVATFHRTWLAQGGIVGDLDEDEAPDEEVPTHWGELLILERVGRGSFGDVYKAREPRLDRIVALKLIRASAKTPEREAETLREGRLLAKVRHPNVATVHGAAGADGRVGFWMEFLEGKNLAEILAEQGSFEPRVAAEIGIALCRALAAVHAQGIIHRDVKAQNVVREHDGRIVLTDFGVGRDAKDLQGEEPSLSGTPLYLAPELFEGKPPSPASDLYALGVLLFYLVTGEFPITGKSFDELRDAHRGRKRRWLKELRKDLPGTFVAAVERALDRDLEKRVVGGVLGLERALGKFLEERPERRRRIRQALQVLGVLFVCGATVAAYVLKDRIAARVHFYRAERLQEKGRHQDAIVELEEAKLLDPRLPGVYWLLMSYRSSHGNYPGALEAAQEGITLCKGSSTRDCLLVNAWSSLLQMDYPKARGYFERAAKIKADEDTLKEIVQLYKNQGRPGSGLEAAKKLRNARGVVEAGELALTLSAANQYADALAAVKELRSRFPEEDYVHWVAGIVNLAADRLKEAEDEFRTLVEKPRDAGYASDGRLLLAQALMFQSRFEEANELLAKDASLDREEGFTRNDAIRSILIAKCFVRLGDDREASLALRGISSLEPILPNLKLFRNAAIVGLEAEDFRFVEAMAGRVGQLSIQYPTELSQSFDLQMQGEIAGRNKDFEKAVGSINEAIKYRDDPQNALSLARVHIDQARCDLAERFLKSVVDRRGLIVGDFYTPWTILNEAKALQKQCSSGE